MEHFIIIVATKIIGGLSRNTDSHTKEKLTYLIIRYLYNMACSTK